MVGNLALIEWDKIAYNIVAYFLKRRTVEPDKQPLLCNGCVARNNGVTVGSCVFCAVRAEVI
jgi:hypothetical protein